MDIDFSKLTDTALYEKMKIEDKVLEKFSQKNPTYRGVKFSIVRNKETGHLNGYIYVKENVPEDVKEDISDVTHGDITYEEIDSGELVLGFDCAHFGDRTPYLENRVEKGTYRDLRYVYNILLDMIDVYEEW